MNRLLILPVLFFTLLVGTPAFSADFDKGWTAYKRGDYATALRIWTPLAKQGNAGAQVWLGAMYEDGTGVTQDDKTAVKWWRLAAEQGSALELLKGMKSRLVTEGIDRCLFDKIAKITGPETKSIVEKYCRSKIENKSLDWLIRNAN